MGDWMQSIRQADITQIDAIVQISISRWQELYPDWEINLLCLDRRKDRNAQLEQTIVMLEKMKNTL